MVGKEGREGGGKEGREGTVGWSPIILTPMDQGRKGLRRNEREGGVDQRRYEGEEGQWD